MRALTRLIAVLALGLSALFVVPATASADTANCVSRGEYRRIDRGMTVTRVTRIFDVRGRITSRSFHGGDRDVWRTYRVCRAWGSPRWSSVDINFDDYAAPRTRDGRLRVYSKSAFIMR